MTSRRGEPPALVPSAHGRWLHFTRAASTAPTSCGGLRVDDGRLERLTEGHHYISGWRRRAARRCPAADADRLPAVDARRSRRTSGVSTPRPRAIAAGPAPADLVQRRRPRRLDAPRAGRAPRRGRRPRHPGLAHPRRRRRAAARPRDPRRPAHALRLVADLGVPDPRRGRDRASSTATRAARRATARRSTTPTTATGAMARCATCLPGSTPSSRTAWPTPTASASPAARTAAT